jgi:predicted GNAT family acetyltransferase
LDLAGHSIALWEHIDSQYDKLLDGRIKAETMEKTQIQHEFDGKRGSFFFEEDQMRFAEMVYLMAEPEKMIIEHTEVKESLRGQGIGQKLLEHLVDYVRKKEIKVKPICKFVKAQFKKREDLQDVLS